LEFENVSASHVKEYFGLEDDLPNIYARIGRDRVVRKAIQEFSGLRILRQDPWECLVSYVCATYKSIPAIKSMIQKLCAKFGDETRFEGRSHHSFPTSRALAEATIAELEQCGLGYRAKYVSGTARIVSEGAVDLERLQQVSYEQARKELLRFPGVGCKVADCVSLFSLGKLEAFPVDVWMRRAILRHYARHLPRKLATNMKSEKSLSNAEYEKLSQFGRSHFGEYAGYAQEYLYHHERLHGQGLTIDQH
jgi:N-glycosylase/DNA lyase